MPRAALIADQNAIQTPPRAARLLEPSGDDRGCRGNHLHLLADFDLRISLAVLTCDGLAVAIFISDEIAPRGYVPRRFNARNAEERNLFERWKSALIGKRLKAPAGRLRRAIAACTLLTGGVPSRNMILSPWTSSRSPHDARHMARSYGCGTNYIGPWPVAFRGSIPFSQVPDFRTDKPRCESQSQRGTHEHDRSAQQRHIEVKLEGKVPGAV